MLLSGCNDDNSGASTVTTPTTPTTTTPTTTTSTIDETPVFEGFKYLNTAKGVDPRQQEAALSQISGIMNAKCDGYECSFTFSGREAVFIYPVVESNSSTASSLNATNTLVSDTLTDQKKHLVFSKKNTLSSLSDNRICPTPNQKRALILAPAVGTYPEGTLNAENEYLIREDIRVELGKLGYERVEGGVGTEANLAKFEATLASNDGEIYGLVLINAHGAKNGAIQTGEIIPFCKNVNCSVNPKIKEGLDANIYGYGGVYNADDKSYYLTILPKWWETKNIAGIKDSASRFYFFASCSVLAEFEDKEKKIPNKLRTYFRENKLNVIGFNNLSRNNTPPGYFWISGRNYKQHGLEFYLDILKDQQNKSISVFESISKLKPNAGNICLDEYSVFYRTDMWGSITSLLIPSVAASECVVSAGNFNLYLSPNACSTATTPVPQSGAPVISNLIVPSSGYVNQGFTVQISY